MRAARRAGGARGDARDRAGRAASAPSVDAPGDTGAVTLAFAHLVDGALVTIGTDTPYTNAAGNAFGVTVVRYFISDVVLTFGDDREWSVPGAHYVDHELSDTLGYSLGTEVTVGALASISFVMGLPPALNVSGAFAAAPESLMEWPEMMGGGYHYLKYEGRYVDAAGAPFAFRAHAGGLGGDDYSFPVVLDATDRAVAVDGTTLTVAMNLEQSFTTPSDWDLNDYFNAGHPGIMNDAAAQASLQQNGFDVFTLEAP